MGRASRPVLLGRGTRQARGLPGAELRNLIPGDPQYGRVQGVLVASVADGSTAERNGLMAGDVIIADKTFYASRYFDVAALVLSMRDTPDGKGYYLIVGSRAKSSKLSGVAGRVLRGQVERAAVETVTMYLGWVRDSLAAR